MKPSYRGYLGLQASRIGHVLWKENRKALALAIQSRVSEVFGMDIHPGCAVGKGVMIDHATGVVFGETAVVGDNCTFLHGVTLGGTGKSRGDRHPKLGSGILVGAGSMILGNITVGDGCKVRRGLEGCRERLERWWGHVINSATSARKGNLHQWLD